MAFYKIRPKSGTKNQWETANPVLGEREIGYEYPNEGLGKGLVKMKMGDGVTAWNDLPYAVADSFSKDDIVNEESDAEDKVPSAKYVNDRFKALKPKQLWSGSAGNGEEIYLSAKLEEFDFITFVFKNGNKTYYNATFLTSTLLKTSESNTAKQILEQSVDMSLYVEAGDHKRLHLWSTISLSLIEVYGY